MIGTTAAQIHANFPGVIMKNLSSKAGAARLAYLSSQELQDLSYAMARNTGGNTTDLVAIATSYAPTQVTRVKAAAAIALIAWTSNGVTQPGATYKRSMKVGGGPAPTLDMTIQEIYLDYRTAPIGGLSVEAALWQTAVYTMSNLALAYGVGTTIGTGIHWLIETYDPAIDDVIGGTLDNILEEMAGPYSTAYGDYMMDEMFFGIAESWVSDGTGGLGDYGTLDQLESLFADCGTGSCQ